MHPPAQPRFCVAVLALAMGACSPPPNWREVQDDAAGLTLQLPCRPERATRPITVRGQPLALRMVGCEADGMLFAVSTIAFGDAPQAQSALRDWQGAVREHLQLNESAAAPAQPFVPAGAVVLPASLRLQGTGRRADGTAVQVDAAWFARGGQLYHAVVLAERGGGFDTDPFFSGLQVRGNDR